MKEPIVLLQEIQKHGVPLYVSGLLDDEATMNVKMHARDVEIKLFRSTTIKHKNLALDIVVRVNGTVILSGYVDHKDEGELISLWEKIGEEYEKLTAKNSEMYYDEIFNRL